MIGRCECKNIEIEWSGIRSEYSPRRRQCSYCISKDASYVSEPDTEIKITVKDKNKIRIVIHGTETADFHECIICNKLAFVTSNIDENVYGIINCDCIIDKNLLGAPQDFSYEGESLEERLKRRKKNWCNSVIINQS